MKVVSRFFQALEKLKASKIIRGKATFAKRYGIDSRNMFKLEKDHARDIFQVEWLSVLVKDYKINPYWLLCGQEPFFQSPYSENVVKSMQNTCKDKGLNSQQTANKEFINND